MPTGAATYDYLVWSLCRKTVVRETTVVTRSQKKGFFFTVPAKLYMRKNLSISVVRERNEAFFFTLTPRSVAYEEIFP